MVAATRRSASKQKQLRRELLSLYTQRQVCVCMLCSNRVRWTAV